MFDLIARLVTDLCICCFILPPKLGLLGRGRSRVGFGLPSLLSGCCLGPIQHFQMEEVAVRKGLSELVEAGTVFGKAGCKKSSYARW